MLALDKWYLDLVAADGTVLIGYSARLQWRALRVGFDAFLLSPPGAAPTERTALLTHPPVRTGSEIRWCPGTLGLRGVWRRQAAPLRRRLLHDARGSIAWLCLQPRASASVTLPDARSIEGDGYVERLRLKLPAAGPGFGSLHWGRFHGGAESLVWIEWQRGRAGRWIFRNGIEQKDAALTDTAVAGLDGGAHLAFGQLRPVRDRRLLPSLASLPGIRRGHVGRLADLHERKWVGRGALRVPGAGDVEGWLIHEEVLWPGAAG